MNLANSSFLTQANLPLAYHQPNYVSGSRKELDLLGLSQADLLANQLNLYSVAQNPHALRGLGMLQQAETPELLFPSYQSRNFSQDQLAELLGLSQQSHTDLYSSRLPISSLSNYGLGGGDDYSQHLSRMGLERGLANNSNNQLNSIMQLLETNDLKAQSQKNLNDLLLMQMNKTGSLNINNQLQSQFQNVSNLGGLLQNQNYLMNQSKPERPSRELYHQNLDLYETDALNKQQLESLNLMYQRQLKEAQNMDLSSAEYENMLQMLRQQQQQQQQQPKARSESKSSQEKVQTPSQNKKSRQERLSSTEEKMLLAQVQPQKAKQPPIEITIQEDPEDEIPPKDTKETPQTGMLIENAAETVETSTTSGTDIPIEPTIQKKLYQCFNRFCLTDKTNEALWAQEKLHNSTICKNCLDAYNKNRYCYFCHQIYHDDETAASNDDKEWIECESCKTWNHIDCETANNMKNLRLLIEKDNNYKYFCPPCQKNTKLESPQKISKLPKSKPSSPPQIIAEPEQLKPIIQLNQHPRPPLDESMLYEEGIKEPMIKKVRLLENTKLPIIQTPPQPNNLVLSKEYQMQSDFAKGKLDKMFQKMQKKKSQVRSFAVIDTSPYIEKLITQYGGRKIQLSEDEIRSDISLFKDLGARNGVMKEKRQDKNEGFALKGAFSSPSLKPINKNQSLATLRTEKVPKGRPPKSVWTNGKKANDNIDEDELSEHTQSEDFTENTKGNSRAMRNRKRD